MGGGFLEGAATVTGSSSFQLSRPLLEDDVEEDEDMVKHGENAVHLTSLFLERLRLFGM